jgi:hypothetical protein
MVSCRKFVLLKQRKHQKELVRGSIDAQIIDHSGNRKPIYRSGKFKRSRHDKKSPIKQVHWACWLE